jgi:GNAT superfamily N-acetyltransferase
MALMKAQRLSTLGGWKEDIAAFAQEWTTRLSAIAGSPSTGAICEEGQAYGYDLYTFEQYRHSGVASNLVIANLHALRELGIKEFYNAVNPRNAGSMKIHLRLGAEPQCFLYGYKVLNWKKAFQGSATGLDSFREWATTRYSLVKNPSPRADRAEP